MRIEIPDTIRLTNPLWTEKILTRKSYNELSKQCTIAGKTLDIHDSKSCIVGETLNLFDESFNEFSSNELSKDNNISYNKIVQKYHKGCKKCVEFSYKFQHIIQEQPMKFETELKNYARHLETNHKRIINNARKQQEKNNNE